jgi:DNA-binding GntR family transcriptional regulator
MISRWFDSANLKGLSGARTLRKTWELGHKIETAMNQEGTNQKISGRILEPVKVTTVSEAVYRQLLNAIVSARIPPGERLVAYRLAKQMNVSQAPLREALSRFEAQGQVSTNQKQGSVVNECSMRDLEVITELRIMLEVKAIRKAALICDVATLCYLEELQQEFRLSLKNRDVDQMLRINKEFHHAIYTTADMPILLQVVKGLWDKVSPYFHILAREVVTYDFEIPLSIHEQILDGLKKRNQLMVCRALRKDITVGLKHLLDFFGLIEDTIEKQLRPSWNRSRAAAKFVAQK